ncbi:flagellar basal body-associated protein FliL [Massilia sp. R2A-15]|uniref:flagellar basal body-associated protein FliL n=1 Tax=Massilia sp. R2A-15 TaxID=3064278 RepID=UPI0027346D93|nr:flagellar basal body-associated protein FliL [Massilia sp. R2A-15]WLI87987.1 flagellar basal body-associated protein FliL [Massilia sp. R2A-15]
MKADPKAEAAPAAKGSNKLIIIIVLALVVLAGGGGAAWFFMQPKAAGPAHKEAAKAGPPEYVAIDQFVVNLQPENGDQYLQVAFTLQVPTQKDGEEIKANMAKVRSRVLLLLSGKKASEIATVEGKHQLAKEIIASLNQPFVDKGEPQQVSDVLFTAFIIQ